TVHGPVNRRGRGGRADRLLVLLPAKAKCVPMCPEDGRNGTQFRSASFSTPPGHSRSPHWKASRTVRPVLESGLRALSSCLARARQIRGTCPLPLKAASFR